MWNRQEGACKIVKFLHNPQPIARVWQTVEVLLGYGAPIRKMDTKGVSLLHLAHDFFHESR